MAICNHLRVGKTLDLLKSALSHVSSATRRRDSAAKRLDDAANAFRECR
jgi:hypothetical protein